MQAEGVELELHRRRHPAIARMAAKVNGSVENIGARRLQTVMERVLDEVSFTAPDRSGEKDRDRRAFVDEHVGDLADNADLSRFILKYATGGVSVDSGIRLRETDEGERRCSTAGEKRHHDQNPASC
jgi:hypothetical protein